MPLNLTKHIRLDAAAIGSANLADRFPREDLVSIYNWCAEGYKQDNQSRTAWFRRTQGAMDLALQVTKEKTFPWPGAANVNFPLVTIAALQFHSRAYPTILPGPNPVKCRLSLSGDPEIIQRAQRVEKYMSYQVMEEDQPWEEQHDRMLLQVPIVGSAFKKSYYDASLGHNVSCLVSSKDLVVNYWAKSIDSARRKTHDYPIYRNEVWEGAATGKFCDVREEAWFLHGPSMRADDSPSDNRTGQSPANGDESAPFAGHEQHCWLDLDGDGYEEPYAVTFVDGATTPLRIVSRCSRGEDVMRDVRGRIIRIAAEEYFTKYGFIPSPDGGIYDIGFGTLLGPLNESANAMLNQLIDAGTMANAAGGFLGRGAKIRGGTYSFSPLEWKRVDSPGDDLRKNIVPLEVRQPSDVLFKLLGFIVDYTNRISGATEMLTGENPGQNTKVGTAEAMVEQGLKIYAAIFKRIWRAQKEEFKKLYILNGMYLPVKKSLWNGIVAMREDFLDSPNYIVPSADPNVVSDSMRIQQAQVLAQRAMSVSGYDPEAVERNLLTALRVDSPERFYPGPQKTGPLPNPKMMVEQEKTKREQLKIRHEAETVLLEMQEQHSLNEAKIRELDAQATKLLADAKGVDITLQINAINAATTAMKHHNDSLEARAKVILEAVTHEQGDRSGAIQHLVGAPGNQGTPPALPQPAGGPQGSMGAGGPGL